MWKVPDPLSFHFPLTCRLSRKEIKARAKPLLNPTSSWKTKISAVVLFLPKVWCTLQTKVGRWPFVAFYFFLYKLFSLSSDEEFLGPRTSCFHFLGSSAPEGTTENESAMRVPSSIFGNHWSPSLKGGKWAIATLAAVSQSHRAPVRLFMYAFSFKKSREIRLLDPFFIIRNFNIQYVVYTICWRYLQPMLKTQSAFYIGK